MPSSPAAHFVTSALADRLLRKAGVPSAWGVTASQFQSLLNRSAAQRFSGVSPDARSVESFAESLHCKDLALASACAAGNSAAWDFFVNTYRPELIALLAPSLRDSAGREIADSLYADLYGLRGSQTGERKSPLDYFLGRSKLSTSLHAVLSRKHIDEIRRTRKTESLDDPTTRRLRLIPAHRNCSSTGVGRPGSRPRTVPRVLQSVLAGVLAALPGRDRLRLAYYYVDEVRRSRKSAKFSASTKPPFRAKLSERAAKFAIKSIACFER